MDTINSPLRRNDIVERALEMRYRTQRAKYYIKWGTINAVLLALITFDVTHKCPHQLYTSWFWLECCIGSVLAFSVLVCLSKYLLYLLKNPAVQGTKEQKHLLSFCDNDKSFIVKTPQKPVAPVVESTPNKFIINWHSSFNEMYGGHSPNWNMNRSSPTRTGQYSPQQQQQQQQQQTTQQQPGQPPSAQQQQQQQMSHNLSWHSSIANNSTFDDSYVSSNDMYCSPYKVYSSDDVIDDDESLQKYLNEFSKRESTMSEVADLASGFYAGTVNSFWNYYNSAANFLLRTSNYQLAPATDPITQNKQSNADDNSFQFIDANSDVIKGISSQKLSQYVANIRVWLSTTILKRLVAEIKHIDEVFKMRGFFDMQIGSVGLERLRKTAEMPEILELMPKLSVILPFLSLTGNQEYLVQRIKDLSNGTCIGDYRWNSGSSYNGVKWDEHLPTDSAILFHLFCVYLDCQLLPLPQGGGRPFSSRYVVMSDDTRSPKEIIAAVDNKAQCAIYCISPMKPKFNFISDKKIHNCSYNRNNLFYVIIQFLIYMKTQQDSCLEGVHLGRTGINMMCVIDD